MIPSVLATQFREGLTDYVETTFPVTSPVFEGSIRHFLEKKDAFFHEPFVSVKLPFRVAEHGNERFDAIHSDYAPYVHQNKAFDRLNGDDPRSTLVATGTGSGKTECFLYPVLEYCYQHRGESGIKALIIYPMNALATDQALRIARLIHSSPELRGNVNVGMYVGGQSSLDSKTMQPDKVITDHETLLQSPPDILLTNYKMLDYLLVRPKDASLWSRNDDPDTLRYIIVDELHTFDGAQGTDLACLIRRLKSRLKVQPGYLCCVGTSATMGGPESRSAMLEYAHAVFGEPFEDDAIVTEDRLSSREFFDQQEVSFHRIPTADEATELAAMAKAEEEEKYLTRATYVWFDEQDWILDPLSDQGRLELGQKLMHHSFFQSLMSVMDARVIQPGALCDELSNVFPIMGSSVGKVILDSMLALVSHARTSDVKGHLRPFLQVQLQVWMRELRRVMGKVDKEQADYILESDLNQAKADRREHYLPVVNCRDCGATGWAGTLDERSQLVVKDIKVFYNQFFAFDKRIRMVFPRRENEENTQLHQKYRFCPQCLYVQNEQNGEDKCGACGHETIPIWMPDIEASKQSSGYVCPFCGGKHSLILVGLRSATAISAGISQLYASRFNDDKKLLAFNDNVQDAAHRASFFNARTWRFGLRTAIQHFVCDGGEGLSLDAFGDALNDYWQSKMTDEEFIDTFIPYNMAGDRAYETLQKTGEFPDEAGRKGLLSDVRKRISYEVLLEYGLSSRIGRTLEKSAASMIAPDLTKIEEAANAILERIHNEAGVRMISYEQLIGFILSWMNHMRQNGAFALPIYAGYIESGAKGYLLSGKHISWMPGGYLNPFFPALQSHGGASSGFEALSDHCWYVRKLLHMLNTTALECPGTVQAASIIIEELEKKKVFIRMEGPKGLPVFGLAPSVYRITRNVCTLRCNVCGHVISAEATHVHYWEGMPCSRSSCGGQYVPKEQRPDYYANLYQNGELVRVHAREHTGLLELGDREQLEIQFKHKKHEHKAWDPNLLSCTPTLEMGIDIGDLSTVVLCSIPPAQSQYLQRIGRAGRTDGNALTIAVANAKPHDLYFYQEPLDMIAGKVDPPGVFLNASAVLERQFVAFCFDNWVKSGIPEIAIPLKVKGVLSKINQANEPVDSFPFNFLAYIKANLSRLSRMFEQMFDREELSDDSRQRIRDFAKGTGADKESLRNRILRVFKELYDQRESMKKDIKKLKKAIDELEQKPKDASFEEEMRELRLERQGLMRIQQEMEDKNTFNFLSEEGLLPNYAFPEAGVILKAILTRRVPLGKAATEENQYGYERLSYEYSRSASAAISEFAPENSFYAGGHKLKIDQVDVATTEPEQWRLCPNCDHAAPVSSLHNVAACPRCGSIAWGDQGQVRTMLKVRTVYSTNRYEDSRSGDESDDRATKFYSKEMLVDVDEAHDVTCGYQTTTGELPFGYEFVSKATLREINFGESDSIGTRLTVAGHEDIRNGFRICKYCGKIQPRGLKAKPIHTRICRAVSQNFKDPFEECMFLYREFTSEAIRILIPSTSLDSSTKKMESFAAAIMLGLKKKFNNVDHLNYCVMDAPVPEADYRKQYMVIFDSVPGGTGYLKELMATSDALMHVFELALEAMETCSCASEQDKDGCYHCLFAYRQSNKINNISRRCAVELLRKIISGKDSLEPIKGISSIAVNSLFDSELEKRFIEAIEQTSTAQCKVEITKVPVNGKEGYFLQIGSCCWEIELQVPFGIERGVAVPSKADFVFWPKTKGNKQRPVVVFTDGFLYHKHIVDADSNKRLAIRTACGYPVWSLTWKDVQERLQTAASSVAIDTLSHDAMPMGKYYEQTIRKRSLPKLNLGSMSSFDLLLRYLADPEADAVFEGNAQALALCMIDQQMSRSEQAFGAWNQEYSILPTLNESITDAVFRKVLIGRWNPISTLCIYACLPVTAVVGMKTADGKQILRFDETQCRLLIRFDDRPTDKDSEFENGWSQFLYSTNMLQFINSALFVTENGCDGNIYNWYALANTQTKEPVHQTSAEAQDAWDTIISEELLDPEAISFAHTLKAAWCPAPSIVGFELDGAVVAEMVWETLKVAIQLPEQLEHKDTLESDNWHVYEMGSTEAISAIRGA